MATLTFMQEANCRDEGAITALKEDELTLLIYQHLDVVLAVGAVKALSGPEGLQNGQANRPPSWACQFIPVMPRLALPFADKQGLLFGKYIFNEGLQGWVLLKDLSADRPLLRRFDFAVTLDVVLPRKPDSTWWWVDTDGGCQGGERGRAPLTS